MKKEYKVSRYIILILTFLIFNIMFINEDKSWLILPPIFSLIAFILSFPSSIVSKKFIKIGDNIKNKILKILFYIFLPIVLLLISVGIGIIVAMFFEYILPGINDLGNALGQALSILFLIFIIIIAVILPYIQTIIVLILKKFKKLIWLMYININIYIKEFKNY